MKLGGFVYPWGNGHYSRMMHLHDAIQKELRKEAEIHYTSSGEIYQKLLQKFPEKNVRLHNIEMPIPIDGKKGPSITLSLLNFLFPISGRSPLISVVASYLKEEGRLYDKEKFDLVINDGDVGSNVIAKKRNVKSVFVTNQFKPKLWASRFYLYPGLEYISKNIAKATKIIVADSPPPNTLCEYNLNFPDELKDKIVYAGHFSKKREVKIIEKTNLEKLIESSDNFGYWMITGNKSTNEITHKTFQRVFSAEEMRSEKRIISHAKNDPSLDKVLSRDGRTYSISEALEKKIDWIQIDIGYLSEQEKDSVLNLCKYAVINGSHTAMGEIIGIKSKPIIGMPVYDEHTNQIKWAQDRNLGILSSSSKQTIRAVKKLHQEYNIFQESLQEFSKIYNQNGAENTAKIIHQMLDD